MNDCHRPSTTRFYFAYFLCLESPEHPGVGTGPARPETANFENLIATLRFLSTFFFYEPSCGLVGWLVCRSISWLVRHMVGWLVGDTSTVQSEHLFEKHLYSKNFFSFHLFSLLIGYLSHPIYICNYLCMKPPPESKMRDLLTPETKKQSSKQSKQFSAATMEYFRLLEVLF